MSVANVNSIRVGLGLVLTTAVLTPGLYQPFLDRLWTLLKYNVIYQASTFETIWTVFCYAAIEPSMLAIFMNHPEWRLAAKNQKSTEPLRRPPGLRRPTKRILEGLTYIGPLLLLDLLMIKKFADVPLEDMLISGNYDPALGRLSSKCWGNTCRRNFLMPSVHNFSWSSPLQTKRALPELAPSSRRLALELIFSFIIYDAAFFIFHLALHVLPGLKTWHAPHHTHAEIHPQITNQLSIFERLGLVLLANFSLNIIGSHVLTRTLFVPIFVWLLVEIHSGLDLPWGYEKILPHGWGGGAKKHAKHHAGTDGGFEPYFEWCDKGLDRLRAMSSSK